MAPATGEVQVLADDDFHETVGASEMPVIVDFWAPWCTPCRFLAPILDELAERYAGRVLFAKVNVQENPNMVSKYRVTVVPTLMTFRNGEPFDLAVGLQASSEIEDMLGKALSS